MAFQHWTSIQLVISWKDLVTISVRPAEPATCPVGPFHALISRLKVVRTKVCSIEVNTFTHSKCREVYHTRHSRTITPEISPNSSDPSNQHYSHPYPTTATQPLRLLPYGQANEMTPPDLPNEYDGGISLDFPGKQRLDKGCMYVIVCIVCLPDVSFSGQVFTANLFVTGRIIPPTFHQAAMGMRMGVSVSRSKYCSWSWLCSYMVDCRLQGREGHSC